MSGMRCMAGSRLRKTAGTGRRLIPPGGRCGLPSLAGNVFDGLGPALGG